MKIYKKRYFIFVVVILIVVVFYQRSLSDSKVTKVLEGEVLQVNQEDSLVKLTLKTPNKNLVIDLCPSWYLEKNNFPLKASDLAKLNVYDCGVQNTCNLTVLKISIKDRKLDLRDSSGKPLW